MEQEILSFVTFDNNQSVVIVLPDGYVSDLGGLRDLRLDQMVEVEAGDRLLRLQVERHVDSEDVLTSPVEGS